MSSFSEMARFSDLANSADVVPGRSENTRAETGSVEPFGSLFLDLRQDPTGLVPDVIGDKPVAKEQVRKPGDSGKPGRAKKPGKSKKKGNAKTTGKFNGRRGIDSLLRNAYRAQLDMLSLAAVKANIMISLNGLLISMLIISGSHFISDDIWFSIPIMLFLLSSALATIFAVLAARPDISRKKCSPEDFRDDKAHLLVFEEFSDLSEKQYVDAMSDMMEDDDRVYKSMISHIHELGSTADRKYRNLYCSYTVFIGGIILSVMSLLILEGMKWTNQLPLV